MEDEPLESHEPDHRTSTSLTLEGQAALGRIAVWAAWLETSLVDLCAMLINPNRYSTGIAVTANMNASALIVMARRLVGESADLSLEARDDILKCLSESKAALEERNKVLHASTGHSLIQGKTVFHGRRRRTGSLGSSDGVHLSPDELDEIGARLFKAQEWVFDCAFPDPASPLGIHSLPRRALSAGAPSGVEDCRGPSGSSDLSGPPTQV